MTQCLQTIKSNCKNCYKCIRNCPVKSIRFTAGQAHIIREECVLCGECYVVCPQNTKTIRNDISIARELIASGSEVFVSLAPSFIANYPGKSVGDVERALIKLGFSGASETAIGAAIVKKQYENMVRSRKSSVIISSCCHTVNTLIQKHYPKALPYLADVITPMQAHCELLKREHENCRVVFIGPCISKKAEAEAYSSVDCVLTFDELDEWLASENIRMESGTPDREKGRTRMFPVSGGIIGSMDKDPGFHYITVDGMENCINAIKDIISGELENCFVEMSACSGSCIAGPVMKRKSRTPFKALLTIDDCVSKKDFDVAVPEEKYLQKNFKAESILRVIPGDSAIKEILRKMGKNSKEQELNCGSCGYNTCLDKAVAVYMGKADISMCLPFLNDKAESFSSTIIHNTPNGIMVLDEQLNVQQINKAAKKILNLPGAADIIGSPVVRILDPIDYILALDKGKNVYDKRKYLADYRKYIEETIIYNEEYHIIIIIMKDISSEVELKNAKEAQNKAAADITDRVVEKQMRIVQEIALLLGETTAETKIALTKLKETLSDE